ncbi:YicC/YloC family endoribonuclease [Yanghanlia caeni]|uniref:YicC/YloC family endoribonuclease n=1 Tax=Yanghanlia caeni TaxID=3064283 RepID=A0ABU1D5H2_9BURK|nr:YicC/YloC family endoribonuclease [Alcaligenaceae bacterium LG-2]
MIRSMTAFGSAKAETDQGTLNIEIRSVNSRFLDLNFRFPEELRMLEAPLREQISRAVTRGKVDVRLSYVRNILPDAAALDPTALTRMAELLAAARAVIPDVQAPRLNELLNAAQGGSGAPLDAETWNAMATEACGKALAELQAAREREGARLAEIMHDCARAMDTIVDEVERSLPHILEEHQQKLAQRLKDALLAASPDGFALITGEELSARIAQETSLFSLRIDVAEELARLRSHIAELSHILAGEADAAIENRPGKKGSAGKRLDFLFQEMNREANTLGSKAGALSMTRAAIDLKLLIEQMREQAQNIE